MTKDSPISTRVSWNRSWKSLVYAKNISIGYQNHTKLHFSGCSKTWSTSLSYSHESKDFKYKMTSSSPLIYEKIAIILASLVLNRSLFYEIGFHCWTFATIKQIFCWQILLYFRDELLFRLARIFLDSLLSSFYFHTLTLLSTWHSRWLGNSTIFNDKSKFLTWICWIQTGKGRFQLSQNQNKIENHATSSVVAKTEFCL